MLKNVFIQKGLSNREAEVAALVSKALSNKEVAGQLFVTEKTVKFHLTNIYKKMAIKSRAQLIVWTLPHLDLAEKQSVEGSVSTPVVNQDRSIPVVDAAVAQGLPSGNDPERSSGF